MSIIFGIANLANNPIGHDSFPSLGDRTKAYAPDGTSIKVDGPIGMGFQPYYTTLRSKLDVQPSTDRRGNMVLLDGRLDNHAELEKLTTAKNVSPTDSQLVLAAFAQWGEDCFAQFVGDWSIALWSPEQRNLYLARDHAGTRTLYYRFADRSVVWSTYLETFLGAKERRTLDEEFAARCVGGLPIRTATPYKEILAVPPGHVLSFSIRRMRSTAHWTPISREKLRYRNPQEYDDQFTECFERAVRRRDLPGASILAELSGGMDSTAIVCMSDVLRRRGNRNAPLLDTVSLYDDSEPDWNELPYVLATEKYRGKTGIHVATSYLNRSFASLQQQRGFAIPGSDSKARLREEEFEARVAAGRYRVVFSGIGGDELLGGVPAPYPELADHLASRRLQTLFVQTTDWCLSQRDVFLPTLLRTVRFALNLYRHPLFDAKALTPWISPYAQKLCLEVAHQEEKQYPRRGYLPSSLSNGRNWLSVLETLPHLHPGTLIRREYRYPYLDRDLVTYLLQVPREQLVQPGRRRAMMRRALRSIMPPEVVERRRKAFLARGLYTLIQRERTNIERLLESSYIEALGLIKISVLRAVLETAASGTETPWAMAFLRTIALELWLRSHDCYLCLPDRPRLSPENSAPSVPKPPVFLR